LIYTFRSND